jgi:hypothetical protein
LSLGRDPPCRKAQPADIHFRDNVPGSQNIKGPISILRWYPLYVTIPINTWKKKNNLRMLLVTRWNPMRMHV